uniref:Uncharacterized protein n=1 Tax=Octopus bimaculoides TaxID=37653 RepID=A0A0L8GW36_OCTBM
MAKAEMRPKKFRKRSNKREQLIIHNRACVDAFCVVMVKVNPLTTKSHISFFFIQSLICIFSSGSDDGSPMKL